AGKAATGGAGGMTGTGGSTAGMGGKGTAGGGSGGKATAGGGGMGGSAGAGTSTGGMGGAHGGSTGMAGAAGTGGASTGSFVIASNDVMDGAKFGGMFTCNGGSLGSGINPELHWSGAPSGAMSFAITFIDTSIGADNAMGQHYAVYNIPASVMEI